MNNKKVALLIGVSEYEHGFNPLPAAVRDVEAMQRVLADSEKGDFTEIKLLKNPQPQEMREAIEQLFADRQEDDLLLFYFSGHGVTDESGNLFLSTSATRKDNDKLVRAKAVEASFLHLNMNDSKSKYQVIILDCCYSGAFAKGFTVKGDGTVNLQEQLGGKGRAILTSSSSTQYSFEQKGSELSIYTQYLVEGIENGEADLDRNTFISAQELHEYASPKVRKAIPTMTPKFYPVEEGYRIFLAKSPKYDPKQKYRKEVERFAREDEGEISTSSSKCLKALRSNLGLSIEETSVIESEVLEQYQKHKENLQTYEADLSEIIQSQYPINEKDRKNLEYIQRNLKLSDEDIAPIVKRVLAKVQKQTFEFEMATISLVKKQVKKPGNFPFVKTACDEIGYNIKRSRQKAEFFTEDLGNGVIMEMVAISGGTFLMGSPNDEPERRDNEGPKHSVTIKPFFMGKFQVTQAQWRTVAGFLKAKIDLSPNPSRFKGVNLPVERVSWNQAVEFCERLSRKTGRNYRLPSEAEWEYACRAGTTTPFNFGETISTDLANYDGNRTYACSPEGIYQEQTTEVGSFPTNAFGLYDMHGNVWEWCADHWHKNYVGAPSDGSIWLSSEESSRRMLRGGSWRSHPVNCRLADRNDNDTDYCNDNIGFRIVCDTGLT